MKRLSRNTHQRETQQAPSSPDMASEYRLASRVAIGFAVVALLALGVFFMKADDIGQKLRSHPTPVMAEGNEAPQAAPTEDVAGDTPTEEGAPSTDEATDVAEVEGDGLDPSTLAEQVDSMSSDEVLALANTLEQVIRDNPDRFERSADDVGAIEKGNLTLAEAYAEAERRFPGDVNAAKRLKLVSDLGSGSYWYYVAERGDTLIALSRSFGVSLGQLVELNGIEDADVLPAGMIILLPDEVVVPDTMAVTK